MIVRATAILAFLAATPVLAQPPAEKQTKIDAAVVKAAGESIDKAIAFYRTQQGPEGGLAPKAAFEMGITALAVSSMLETKRITPNDPMIAKAMAFLEKHVQPDGGIYPKGVEAQQNYLTAVGLLAFVAADTGGKYKSVRENAIKFLKGMQWHEEGAGANKVDVNNINYGGFGYDSKKRPDLSNTSFTLESLHKAGLSNDDPAVQRAMIFLRRCQNYTGEGGNDKAQGAPEDMDGGFIYSPSESKSPAGNSPTGGLRSYASMTYAGLKSFVYAGLKKNDPRVQAALEWIKKHYDLEQNPGMGQSGLYYYYQVFAKALKAAEIDAVATAAGEPRNWRKDLVQTLIAKQQPDGSWINKDKRWLENDARLVTAYSLAAMANALR
jgi:squalene-hopene/tetraprenyl-beta-curcumene cyclase